MRKGAWRHICVGLLAAALTVSLVGCGGLPESPGGKNGPVQLGADLKPTVQPREELDRQQAAALTDFGLRLAWHSLAGEENGLVSPVSVATALAMTANGAEQGTLEELEAVLGMDRDSLNRAMLDYWSGLPQEEKAAVYGANAIWFSDQGGFSADPDFLQTCADYYQAELFQAPMDQSTCRQLNRWVKDHTRGMIPDMLEKLSPETVMCLVNALAFEGEWAEIYEDDQVQEGVFLTHTGQPVRTDFLYSEEYRYLENQVAVGVMKPYVGGRYAFVGLLPKGDMSLMALLDALDGESLQRLLRTPQETRVQTMIPKFETDCQLDMKQVLIDMGLSRAFSEEEAELQGLGTSPRGPLYLDRVLHRTFLSLGERGTRAGAATVVEVKPDSALEQEKPREVLLDRPFIYLLIDTETCVPLFIGAMRDPTGQAPETPAGGAPLSVQVDGALYVHTGQKRPSDQPGCGVMDGEITSAVGPGETPHRDGQSNFGTGWGYQGSGQTITVYLGRHRLIFERVQEG